MSFCGRRNRDWRGRRVHHRGRCRRGWRRRRCSNGSGRRGPWRGRLGRRSLGPPVGTLVQSAKALVSLFFAREKFGNAFEALDSFRLERVLNENLHLNDEVFECLLRALFFGYGSSRRARVAGPAEAIRTRGNRSGFRGPRENVLEEAGVHFALEFGDALVIAVVVGIDVDETIEGVAGFSHASRSKVQIEETNERIEVLGFAVHFLIEARDRLRDAEGIRIGGGDAVHLRGEFDFLARTAHPFLGLVEDGGGLVVLPRANVGARKLEEFPETVRLLLVVRLECLARAIEASGSKER